MSAKAGKLDVIYISQSVSQSANKCNKDTKEMKVRKGKERYGKVWKDKDWSGKVKKGKVR